MEESLFVSLIFNISLLVLAATVLTELAPLRELFLANRRGLRDQMLLAVIFGTMAVLSTYGGIRMMDAIVNTRVISVAAAGLLGGPVAGIGAGLIGGIHRYFYAPESFTAFACCMGTISFGIIGGLAHREDYSQTLPSRPMLVAVTVMGELVQVVWIFALSRPISAVIQLESVILLPKLVINSLGMVLFFGIIHRLQLSRHQVELRRRAELKALQSQINPHFFCNALTAISSLCRTDGDKARHLLLVLADYYRQTLSINEDFVPLENELRNVDNYLTIAQTRFEDAIHLTSTLPEDMSDCVLPPLIIQPIVENAVRHGGTSTHDRHLALAITRQGDWLTVAVSDQGHGFDQAVLADLKNPDSPRYTGMFNVHKRLQSIYGAANGLQVDSSPQGSTVRFTVPIHPKSQKGGFTP